MVKSMKINLNATEITNSGHFGDPRNFIVSKIPYLTISCSSLKKGKSVFIHKIMAGVWETIYDWSDKVNMHLIRSYVQYLDSNIQ